MDSNLYDHVRCLYCEGESLIPMGSDVCIKCGTSGYLVWNDRDNEEAHPGDFDADEADALLTGEFWIEAEVDGAR